MDEKDSIKIEASEKKTIDADGTKNVVNKESITVVLKLDLHCDGCAKKVKKSVRYIEGVETVKADSTNNKLTITGKVDPTHIKERVEYKTKKKVEIISPKPKKEDEGVKKADGKIHETKSEDKKPKEPQSTSVVLKIPLHCDGCIQKIKRIISKIDGVESVKPDGAKNLVTVNGTMNMKELVPYLKDKLKRNVDIAPPKKEDNKGGEKKGEKKVEGSEGKTVKKDDNDGDKKNDAVKETGGTEGGENKKKDDVKATSGGDEKKSDTDAKTTSGGDDKKSNTDPKTTGGGGGDGDMSKKADVMNKFEYYRQNPYIYTMPIYNQNYHNQDYGISVFSTHGYGDEGYVNTEYAMEYLHGPPPPPSPMSLHNARASENDIFSAENPNGCLIM